MNIRVEWETYDINNEHINSHPNLRHHVFISKETTRLLASYIIEEPWGHDQNMLYKYLDYIWRCQLFDKQVKKFAVINKDDNSQYTHLTFHTGLQRRYDGEFIFLLLTPNDTDKRNVEQKWRVPMENWFVTKQYFLSLGSNINDIPKRTKFYNTLEELIFNPDYDIDVDWNERLKTNKDRIYDKLSINGQKITEKTMDLAHLSVIFKHACNKSLNIAHGNPRWVVPQAFVDSSKKRHRLELLLPLFITLDEGKTTEVFALALQPSKNKYSGMSILTGEMAYANARLVGCIDSHWLANVITNEEMSHVNHTINEEETKTSSDDNNETVPALSTSHSFHSLHNGINTTNSNAGIAGSQQQINPATNNIIPMPHIISTSMPANTTLPTGSVNNIAPVPHIIPTSNFGQTQLAMPLLNNNASQITLLGRQQEQSQSLLPAGQQTNINNDISNQQALMNRNSNRYFQSFGNKFGNPADASNAYSSTIPYSSMRGYYPYNPVYTSYSYCTQQQQVPSYNYPTNNTMTNHLTNTLPTSLNSSYFPQGNNILTNGAANNRETMTLPSIDIVNQNLPSFGSAGEAFTPPAQQLQHQSRMSFDANVTRPNTTHNIEPMTHMIQPNIQNEIMTPLNILSLNTTDQQHVSISTPTPLVKQQTKLFLSQLPLTPSFRNVPTSLVSTPNSTTSLLNFSNLLTKEASNNLNFNFEPFTKSQSDLHLNVPSKLPIIQSPHRNEKLAIDVTISKSWNEQNLRNFLQGLEIDHITLNSSNMNENANKSPRYKASIHMKYPQDAILARNTIIHDKSRNGIEISPLSLYALRVSNLLPNTSISLLTQYFSEFGAIKSIHLFHGDNVAYVQYAINDNMTSALNRSKTHKQWKVDETTEYDFIFFEENCQVWQYQINGTWQFYSNKISEQIEQIPVGETMQVIDGILQDLVVRHDVDFGKQINMDTKNERVIRRLHIDVWKSTDTSINDSYGELFKLWNPQETLITPLLPSQQRQTSGASMTEEVTGIKSPSIGPPIMMKPATPTSVVTYQHEEAPSQPLTSQDKLQKQVNNSNPQILMKDNKISNVETAGALNNDYHNNQVNVPGTAGVTIPLRLQNQSTTKTQNNVNTNNNQYSTIRNGSTHTVVGPEEYKKLTDEIGTNEILEIRFHDNKHNSNNNYQGYIPQTAWFCDNWKKNHKSGFIQEEGSRYTFYAKPQDSCVSAQPNENGEIHLFKCEIFLTNDEYNLFINDHRITLDDMSRIRILYILRLYKHSLMSSRDTITKNYNDNKTQASALGSFIYKNKNDRSFSKTVS